MDHSSLSNGEISIQAGQEDSVENEFFIVEDIEKDTSDPILNFSANNIFPSNESSYSINGTCSEEGQTVTVVFTDSDSSTVDETSPCSSGTWSLTSVDLSNLAHGDIDVRVSQQDSLENTGNLTQTITKSDASTQVTLTTPSPINASNESDYPLTGTCTPSGQAVTVSVGGQSPDSPVTCTSQSWSARFNLSSLSDHSSITISVNYNANSQEAPGRTATVIKDTEAPSLTLNTPSEEVNRMNDSSYTLSGTCSDDGIAVNILVMDSETLANEVAESVLCTSQLWSQDMDLTSLQAGGLSFTISHEDLAQNEAPEQTATINRNNDVILTLNEPDNILENNETQYSLSGTCSEAGDSVDVSFTDSSNTSLSPQPQPNCEIDFTWGVSNFNGSSLGDGTINISMTHSGITITNPVQKGCVSGGGDGSSAEDPIIVCNYTDLNNIRNDLTKHYALGQDIDASNSWEEGSNVDDGNGGITACTPYDGNLDTELTDSYCSGMDPLGGNFEGSLDGQNYKIESLYINANKVLVGLVGYFYGSIRNLHLHSSRVHSRYSGQSFSGVGGLVGRDYYGNDGFIDNCSIVSGKISGVKGDVGGLIGIGGSSTTSNSFTKNMTVEGGSSSHVGGFMGRAGGGSVASSYAVGGVVRGGYAGGFSGLITEGEIESSYANNMDVFGEIEASSFLAEYLTDGSKVLHSYGRGGVNVGDEGILGGFISSIGGSELAISIQNNFWDTEITNITASVGSYVEGVSPLNNNEVRGLTTAQMKLPCPGSGGESDPNDICDLGAAYLYSDESLSVEDQHYPKLRKCIICDLSDIGGNIYSDELVGEQE